MKNKISLSRNKTNKYLNLFLSPSAKKGKNYIFKTSQKESKTISTVTNRYSRGLKNKKINNIFSVKKYDNYLKTEYNKNFSKKILINDESNSKVASPLSTIRYNSSSRRFQHNTNSKQKYKISTSYNGCNLIKLNKPYLLKLLDKQIIYKTLKLKDSNNKSSIPYTTSIIINHKIINNSKIQINNVFNKKKDKIYKLKELYQQIKCDDKYNTPRGVLKSFKKMKELRINFPIEFPNDSSYDKSELRDKANINYYNDEKIKKRIRKALYFDINSFDYDNGNYWEYKKSIPNCYNFIFDINILPHLKNKFWYNKNINIINRQIQINNIIFNRNEISKECAETLNRYIINNIRKEILEKEEIKKREKKIRELAKSNKILLKLYMEKKDEDLPELTSDEIVELNDYFRKNIDYKYLKIANNKLRRIVYGEKKFFKKKTKYK